MKKFTLLASMFSLAIMANSQTYDPIAATGFNEDIVVEASPALSTSSISMDGSNYVFYSEAYGATQGSTKGLPDNLLVSSGNYSYELEDYTGNNTLYVTNPGGMDTLELVTPANYGSISILCLSTEGAGIMDVELIFSDGTSSTTTGLAVNDWFYAAGYIINDIDRVGRNTGTVANIIGNPRMYNVDVSVSCAEENKLLSKVVFTNQSTTNGRIYVMALAGSDPFSVDLGNYTDLQCNNGSDGYAEVLVTGGQGPFSYNWNPGPTSSLNQINSLDAGTHKCIVTDARGCVDSTASFTLTEPAPITASQNATTCAGYPYVIGNSYHYDAGTYVDIIPAANGCDSVVTTTLTVTVAPEYSETASICEGTSYDIGSNSYTTAGVYRDTLSAVDFCDSIVITTLTVTDANADVDLDELTLSAIYTNANYTYSWLDCDTGLPIAGEDGEEFTVTQNGSYALIVENNGCTDTSVCEIIDYVGIEEYKQNSMISIFPNPANDILSFETDLTITSVEIIDIKGQIVLRKHETGIKNLSIEALKKGVYIIRVNSNDASTETIRLVKN